MKKILLVILILLIPTLPAGPITSENYAIFSMYNASSGEWLNLTISTEKYNLSASNPIYNLEFEFLFNPWYRIEEVLDENNFFKSSILEDNPHTIIEVDLDGRYNKQTISHINIQPEVIPLFFQEILNRLTGKQSGNLVWPVDIQIIIMESYPEQYGVTAKIYRGFDSTKCCGTGNITLIVTDSDPFFHPDFDLKSKEEFNALHSETSNYSINNFGSSLDINFGTFTLGTSYSPIDLFYTIILDNGLYIIYGANSSKLPSIGYVEDFAIFLETPSDLVELPFIWISLIGIIVIQLLRKKKNKI